nr:MAG TPA: hypothetical protein [Siphovirus LN-2020-1]
MTDNLFFIDEDEVLAHHGVKGMKWGVRKQRAASGGAGSTKKRKGLSRKQKAAIAGVLGTAAAAGAGYYLHKSGKGKQLAGLAKKGGASAKKYAQGKGRNLGAQARVKTAQAKRQARAFGKDAKNFAGAQAALGKLMVADTKRRAKAAASKLKYSKAGKYAEATRLAANAAAFKTGNAARSAGFRAKQGAWKVGNKARRAATGGVRAAAGSAKSKVGAAAGGAAKSTASAKTPGKALQVSSRAVGYRKLHTSGTKVVRPKGAAADKLVKASVAGLATGVGGGALQYAALKAMSGGKKKRGRSRKRRR